MQGLGKKMIEKYFYIAEKEGKKAVRLDALESNVPAHKMYESLVFRICGKQNLYAENTGWTDFVFFEYCGGAKNDN